MKQFLYLDTDIVNSIIAQSEKGLIQEQSEENGSDKKKGTHISGSMEGSGTAGGSFLKLAKAEARESVYEDDDKGGLSVRSGQGAREK